MLHLVLFTLTTTMVGLDWISVVSQVLNLKDVIVQCAVLLLVYGVLLVTGGGIVGLVDLWVVVVVLLLERELCQVHFVYHFEVTILMIVLHRDLKFSHNFVSLVN